MKNKCTDIETSTVNKLKDKRKQQNYITFISCTSMYIVSIIINASMCGYRIQEGDWFLSCCKVYHKLNLPGIDITGRQFLNIAYQIKYRLSPDIHTHSHTNTHTHISHLFFIRWSILVVR